MAGVGCAALHGKALVAARSGEPRNGNDVGEMLVVVPVVELVLAPFNGVGENHED
jgi:hypothetical protein